MARYRERRKKRCKQDSRKIGRHGEKIVREISAEEKIVEQTARSGNFLGVRSADKHGPADTVNYQNNRLQRARPKGGNYPCAEGIPAPAIQASRLSELRGAIRADGIRLKSIKRFL